MTPKEFKAKYYADIREACTVTGLNPLFVASQAALETGWGRSAIGNNLFGITATDKWKGARKTVITHEYFKDCEQGHRFSKVHSITPLADGRYKYVVERAFRDYPSVRDCIIDHFNVLSLPRYREGFDHKGDIYKFAYAIARAGYCTADPDTYASSILSISKTILKS